MKILIMQKIIGCFVADLTILLIAGSFSIIKATSLGSSVATHSS